MEKKIHPAGLPETSLYFFWLYFSLCTINNMQMSNGMDLCQSDLLSEMVLSRERYYPFLCDDLFKILRKQKSGCWIHNDFFGIIDYADAIFLLSPSLDVFQDMIATCENYASAHNLSFSTDVNPNRCKTKCLAA